MPTVCCDWDDTLCGYKKHPPGWLPGAKEALYTLKRLGLTVVIHSCRANWPEGLAEIETTLAEAGFRLNSKLKIHTGPGKPQGIAYIDDRAVRFDGNWGAALRAVMSTKEGVELVSRQNRKRTGAPTRRRTPQA